MKSVNLCKSEGFGHVQEFFNPIKRKKWQVEMRFVNESLKPFVHTAFQLSKFGYIQNASKNIL